jgi:hypothetical protein
MVSLLNNNSKLFYWKKLPTEFAYLKSYNFIEADKYAYSGGDNKVWKQQA